MRKIYIAFIIICTSVLYSCTDLEKYPLDGPSSETYPTNESELMSLLNGVYSLNSFSTADGMTLPIILDAVTDIGYDRNTGELHQLGNGNGADNNGFVRDLWRNAYQVIGRCNFLLTNMNRAEAATSPDTYKSIRAEARFVRAYTYHYLIEAFDGVPLVTTTLTLDDSNMPRNSKEEVLDFIMTELDEAAADMPNDYNGTGRAAKGAALAIKARAALYNEKWDIAAKAAQDAMNLNVHSLHENFGELFSYNGQESKEIIWAHQYLTSANKTTSTCANLVSRNGKGYSNKVPAQALVDAYQCIDGKDIDKSDLYNPEKPFEKRDPRLSYTIALPGSVFFGYQFETHRDSVECWDYNSVPAIRIPNQDGINAYASFTGYCWKKYVDITDKNNPNNSQLNATIIRYAEVLLIYAEAKIELNQIDQSVYDALNAVRQRPSVNMPAVPTGLGQADLRSVVHKERLYELAMEGFRWYDIRRWKIAEKVMNGSFYGRIPTGLLSSAPKIDENGVPDYSVVANRSEMRVVQERKFNPDRDYLWPIPEREMTANPAMTQNPNY